jgi:hypothetical protein
VGIVTNVSATAGANPVTGTFKDAEEAQGEHTMSTLLGERIETGDVIEIAHNGEWISTLVLLATPEALILDPCDGSVPFVVLPEELGEHRIFTGA